MSCLWVYDEDEDSWNGACGAKWTLIDGGPVENKMNYCPECGKKLEEIPNE